LLYYLDFLILTVYIYIQVINLILTKQQGVGYKLVSKFLNTNTKSSAKSCDFPINFNIKTTKDPSH
jgi:hypothetical protein